jgi:small subunit ribosomal protein S2
LARRNAYKLVYIKERIAHLKDLEQQEASGTFDLLTKKEAALRKELTKLRRHLDGIKTMVVYLMWPYY